VIVWPDCGYTTRTEIGPSTSGTAGNAGALTATGPVAGAVTGIGVRAQETTRTSAATVRMRMEGK
jgi:hypothetical protein